MCPQLSTLLPGPAFLLGLALGAEGVFRSHGRLKPPITNPRNFSAYICIPLFLCVTLRKSPRSKVLEAKGLEREPKLEALNRGPAEQVLGNSAKAVRNAIETTVNGQVAALFEDSLVIGVLV